MTTREKNKRPAWTRVLDIVLRTAHVLVISALFGGAVFNIPAARLIPWQILASASGCGLIVSEVLHSLHWPYQGRGVMVYLHAGLFILACILPTLAPECLAAAIVIGIAGSHMPKRLRHWSFIHRRVMDL
jgi:hypothetical protein